MKTRLKLIILLIAALFISQHTDAYYARYCGHNEHGEGGLGHKSTVKYFMQVSGMNDTTNRLYPERLYGIAGVQEVSLGWANSQPIGGCY